MLRKHGLSEFLTYSTDCASPWVFTYNYIITLPVNLTIKRHRSRVDPFVFRHTDIID